MMNPIAVTAERARARSSDPAGVERRRSRGGGDVHRRRARQQPEPARHASRVRGVRADGGEGARADLPRGRSRVAGHAAGGAPSHRAPGDRRSEHRDCRRERASRGGVRRLPLRDRAREADRADLEARVLRRRRGLDRRRDRQPGRRGGAAGSAVRGRACA